MELGLGKTTLAHTIARHAGYTVREINASDDRSPEAFRLALQNGTEMQTTLLDQEKRPNCIILGMTFLLFPLTKTKYSIHLKNKMCLNEI